MQDNTDSTAAAIVTADAVTGSTKSKQFHVTPSPIVKSVIEIVRDELGLKNIEEACDAIFGALLGSLPYEENGESKSDAANRIGMALAGLDSMKAAGENIENMRKLRKIIADKEKAKALSDKRDKEEAELRAKLGK
jgi:hypothetical protein